MRAAHELGPALPSCRFYVAPSRRGWDPKGAVLGTQLMIGEGDAAKVAEAAWRAQSNTLGSWSQLTLAYRLPGLSSQRPQ